MVDVVVAIVKARMAERKVDWGMQASYCRLQLR